MRRFRTTIVAVMAAVGVTLLAAAVLWWYTDSSTFVVGLTLRGLAIGLIVGFLTTILSLGKPTAKRLAASAPWASRPYLVPGEPPPPPMYFVGRDTSLADATGHLHRPRLGARRPFVLLIHGQPGVGKSGLALTAAASVAHRFRDGVVYASMADANVGSARLHNVLGDLVDSLQGPGDKVPTTTEGRQKELRRLSRRKRHVLFVLDGVVDPGAVEAVMPASPRSAVLITSRRNIDLKRPIERIELRPLSVDASVKLLCSLLLGATEADDATRTAIRRVAVSAAGYPVALHLAVRAIASRGLWALPELAADLPDETGQLDEQTARDRMLDLSVNALSDTQRRALLSLAWLSKPTFVPWMVQALADLPQEDDAWLICDRLADQRLLERVAPDATGVVELRLPDSVAAYVRVRAGREYSDDERDRALQRLRTAPGRRRTASVAEILALLNKGRAAQALDEARGALAEAVGGDPLGAARALKPAGREALAVLAEVLAELGGLDDAMEIATAEERARLESGSKERPNDAAEARLRRSLGRLLRRAWKLKESERTLNDAHALAVLAEDADEQVSALRELALVESMRTDKAANFTRANATLDKAHDLLDSCENATYLECRLIEARVMVLLNGDGRHRANADQLQDARRDLDRALALLPREFALWQAWLTYQQARVLIRQAENADRANLLEADDGDIVSGPDQARRLRFEARRLAENALDSFAAMSHRYGSARCRLEIGRIYAVDRAEAAVPLLEEARETFFFCGDRWIEAQTALVLADVRARSRTAVAAGHAELDFAERVFDGLRDQADLARVRTVRKALRMAVR
jgi:hypothetical protein